MQTRMKMWVKMLVAAVLAGGVVFSAVAQIHLDASTIQIRAPGTATNGWTFHHGSLSLLDGAPSGIGEWGRLWCNRVTVLQGDIIIGLGTLQIHNGGLYVAGVKSFIHPHPTDESKLIRYIAIESGEALTVARGVAKTVGGEVIIELPEHFSMVTSQEAPITVIVTPEGAPVLLYVREKSREKIVVAMREPDFVEFRDVEFSYQVTGVRDGFEKIEVVVDEDKLDPRDSVRRDVQGRIDAYGERVRTRMDRQLEELGGAR